ncbi:MAG: dephospho-CoA kinase [Chloroflexota bacterium]
MRIIGLTGGIGTGKSTVARFLEEMGARVIDADRVGHEALKSGGEVFRQVVAAFGEGILGEDGEIDRARLGKIVFARAADRRKLNAIIHPAMQEMVAAQLKTLRNQGVEAVVLDAPLLLDEGWQSLVDEVWVTTAPENTVIARTQARTRLPPEEIRARIRSQMPAAEKVKRADAVIENSGTVEELRKRVREVWEGRKDGAR